MSDMKNSKIYLTKELLNCKHDNQCEMQLRSAFEDAKKHELKIKAFKMKRIKQNEALIN